MTAIITAPTVGVDNADDWQDFFAGAGGSTTGLRAAGAPVRRAVNHWSQALASHEANHPEVEHKQADLDLEDFRDYPRTFALWASPVCTWASRARGEHREIQQMSLLDKQRHDEREKARMGMYDVWKYAEIHRPVVIVVENVKEVYTKHPEHWRCWWAEGEKLGYRMRVLSLNSMLWEVPQSRDRIYVVAVLKTAPWPDLEFRPPCWCARCEQTVEGVQSWRRLDRPHIGCLGEQFDYRCPTCGRVCWPWTRPALAALDLTLKGIRIGDRASLGMRPLAPGTISRIRRGLTRFGYADAVIPTDRNRDADSKRPRALELPLPTQTSRATLGLYTTPGGREAWITKFYGTSTGSRLTEPLGTVTADGNHLGLVAPPGVDPREVYVVAHYNPGWTRQAATAPFGTVTATDHHSMLIPAGGTWRTEAASTMRPFPARTTSETDALVTVPFLVPYYGNGRARIVDQPMNTLRSVDTNALVDPALGVDVEDCLFRMLEPYEAKWAMGFPREYRILGNRRQQTKQAGNAVTPPVARAIAERIREAFL